MHRGLTELASGVHTVARRTIERWYAAAAGVPKSGRTSSVTATQRFGSDDRLSFRRVVPHTEDIERLVVRIAEACEAWLARQGFGAEDEGDGDDDTQAVIQQASLVGQAALGERAGKRARRVQVLGGKELALRPRAQTSAGTACTPEWGSRRATAPASSGCAATSSARRWPRTVSSAATTATSWWGSSACGVTGPRPLSSPRPSSSNVSSPSYRHPVQIR